MLHVALFIYGLPERGDAARRLHHVYRRALTVVLSSQQVTAESSQAGT